MFGSLLNLLNATHTLRPAVSACEEAEGKKMFRDGAKMKKYAKNVGVSIATIPDQKRGEAMFVLMSIGSHR